MEVKDLQSDLEALRKLYGLVQCGGDVASNVVLGERSKLLLKELLDGATERVLETHTKIIAAAEHGVCGTSCSSESEQSRAVSEFHPSVSPSVKAAAGFTTQSNHFEFGSQKDDNSPNKLTIHEATSQEPRLCFSSDKPENTRKCWELTKQGSIKQQSTAMMLSKGSKPQGQPCDPLAHFYQASRDERKLLKRNKKGMKLLKIDETMGRGFQGIPSKVGSVVGSSKSLASGDNLADQHEKKGEAANNFAKDVDNVVKHIESHISALRLCSKLADATKGSVPHVMGNLPTSVCLVARANEYLFRKSEISYAGKPFSDRDELPNQRIGKKGDSYESHGTLSQSEYDLLDEIMSKKGRIQQKETGETDKHIVRNNNYNGLIRRASHRVENPMLEADKQSPTSSCYVHGLRVPIKQDDIPHKRPPVPVKMPCPVPVNNWTPKIGKLRPSIQAQSAESKASVRRRLIRDKKDRVDQEASRQQKERAMGILRNKMILHQQESEESSTAGRGSSDGEAYSFPSQGTSSAAASSISGGFGHRVYENSSSSTSTASSDYSDVGESGRLLYPSRKADKAMGPVNSDAGKAVGKVGRLRRFKNKLGLIFHHHHHHHHHHRYDHNNSGDDSKGVQTKSMWTHLQKLFHHRNRRRDAVDDSRLRKANVGVPAKHQVGHFHALVEGLIQHLRHSKKSKGVGVGVGGMRKLDNIGQQQQQQQQHGNNKNRRLKQLDWWHMFQRQGGVKLPNTRRVKIKMGFTSKKQQQQQQLRVRVPKLR